MGEHARDADALIELMCKWMPNPLLAETNALQS